MEQAHLPHEVACWEYQESQRACCSHRKSFSLGVERLRPFSPGLRALGSAPQRATTKENSDVFARARSSGEKGRSLATPKKLRKVLTARFVESSNPSSEP